MHIDLYLVLGSAIVGALVGLTGTGGGALMTPMLVLFFSVTPSAAIASDLMAALFMKPLGAAIHWRRRTVNTSLVRYLCLGSVPAAFAGTLTMHLIGHTAAAEHVLQVLLGAALVVGALAMLSRSLFMESAPHGAPEVVTRPLATVVVGAIGGFMVGLTSVGAGSLILVLLVMLYPTLRNDQLVGTDLAQSLPLTLSATAGTLLFSHVNMGVTASLIIGSVPAVVIGSLLSSRTNGFVLRRVITGVVLITGLKYTGASPVVVVAVALALVVLLVLVALGRAMAQRGTSSGVLVAEAVEDVVALLPTRLDRDL